MLKNVFVVERGWGIGWGANVLPREVSTAQFWELQLLKNGLQTSLICWPPSAPGISKGIY